MLTRKGTTNGECCGKDRFSTGPEAGDLMRIGRIEEDVGVEVAITGMAKDHNWQLVFT